MTMSGTKSKSGPGPEYEDIKRMNSNKEVNSSELEQRILAAVRRAHDEFALNGFEGMAATMTMAEREVRDLATIVRTQNRVLKNVRRYIVNCDHEPAVDEIDAALGIIAPSSDAEFGCKP